MLFFLPEGTPYRLQIIPDCHCRREEVFTGSASFDGMPGIRPKKRNNPKWPVKINNGLLQAIYSSSRLLILPLVKEKPMIAPYLIKKTKAMKKTAILLAAMFTVTFVNAQKISDKEIPAAVKNT